jgi:hypothetical protein
MIDVREGGEGKSGDICIDAGKEGGAIFGDGVVGVSDRLVKTCNPLKMLSADGSF